MLDTESAFNKPFLRKYLNVLKSNCSQYLGSFSGCRRPFWENWQPTSVRGHHLCWRWDKFVLQPVLPLYHEVGWPDIITMIRNLESNSCVEAVVVKLSFLMNLQSFSFLLSGKLRIENTLSFYSIAESGRTLSSFICIVTETVVATVPWFFLHLDCD